MDSGTLTGATGGPSPGAAPSRRRSLGPAAGQVLAYHRRTQHHLERYAAGPQILDWTAQPNPFREYEGCERTRLPLHLDPLQVSFAALHAAAGRSPGPLSLESVGALLGLSLALSAWKEYGPDRWALRCNPSSGNLHPTEGYVICDGIAGLADGVLHYVSRDHVLEQRCAVEWARPAAPRTAGSRRGALWLALSSVHWREAWKYGERAYRYCQLDVGHAAGAIAYAAAVLGWSARLVDCDDPQLAALLGLDRTEDYAGAEREHPDLLLAILPQPAPSRALCTAAEHRVPVARTARWRGRANLLDPHPMYRWPVIDEVAAAARQVSRGRRREVNQRLLRGPGLDGPEAPAVKLIQGRRSAQAFERRYTMTDADFFRLLGSLSPRQMLPWHLWRYRARVHPLIFVHRVSGLDPGLYALPRHPQGERLLRAALHKEFLWRRVGEPCGDLPLFLLFPGDLRQAARILSCHQGIAGDSAFSLAMLAELGPVVRAAPWRYRQLFWEAGLLGQVLYLQAESAAARGTGIGCYFDDAVHQFLGLQDDGLQSLYHFTAGHALRDERIRTQAPYPSAPGNPATL